MASALLKACDALGTLRKDSGDCLEPSGKERGVSGSKANRDLRCSQLCAWACLPRSCFPIRAPGAERACMTRVAPQHPPCPASPVHVCSHAHVCMQFPSETGCGGRHIWADGLAQPQALWPPTVLRPQGYPCPATCEPQHGLVPVAAPVWGFLDDCAFAALSEADVLVHLVDSLIPVTGKLREVGAGAGAAQLPCLAGGTPGGREGKANVFLTNLYLTAVH